MTELAIVESRADSASVHVCERLREVADWESLDDGSRPAADGGGTYYRTDGAELRSFDDLHLHLERPADAYTCDPDLLVFASRHAGDTGPLFTGHFTGNVGPAEFGGEDHDVAAAAPNALAHLLAAFGRHGPDGYDVGMECTHHGPTDVGCPSLFAELGSDEPQWGDPAGAEAVARSILDLRGVEPHRRPRQVVGLGGDHYAPRFERIVRETPWAVGHVAADWALEAFEEADPGPDRRRETFRALFEASESELAVVDGDRPALERELADLDVRVVGETWLRVVGDRPLELVGAVESALGDVDDGVRFGDRETTAFGVVDLPEALVAAAEAADVAAARTAVETHAVAFDTVESGNRLGERVALPDSLLEDRPDGARLPDSLVEGLAEVLSERFDAVDVEPDAILAEERAFDPALAREAGVPEGPKFGALSAGEPVTVDGERIDPTDVHVERTHRFER